MKEEALERNGSEITSESRDNLDDSDAKVILAFSFVSWPVKRSYVRSLIRTVT